MILDQSEIYEAIFCFSVAVFTVFYLCGAVLLSKVPMVQNYSFFCSVEFY